VRFCLLQSSPDFAAMFETDMKAAKQCTRAHCHSITHGRD
jgi:hypothetical protein